MTTLTSMLEEAQATVSTVLRQVDRSNLQVVVRWNPRMRTAMGRAIPVHRPGVVRGLRFRRAGGIIELNPKLYYAAEPSDRDDTTRHELAHILADLEAGASVGHGPAWKAMARRVGCSAARCHDVAAAKPLRRPQRRWTVPCPGCGHAMVMSTRRKNQVLQKRNAIWHTRCCNAVLKPDYVRSAARPESA